VARLSADAKTLVALTYVGGSSDETVEDLALDSSGNVVLVGRTYSADLLNGVAGANIDYGSYQSGSSAGYVLRLNSLLTSAGYGTYLQGTGDDDAHSVVRLSDNTMLVGGMTASSGFPVVPAGSSLKGAGWDAFTTNITTVASLKAIYVTPSPNVPSGNSFTVTAELDRPAESSTTVVLRDDSPATSLLPSGTTLTIPTGSRSASLTVTTSVVGSKVLVPIAAMANTIEVGTQTNLLPPGPTQVTFSNSTPKGGNSVTGTVRLAKKAPAGGVLVQLRSNSSSATVPTSVTVAENADTANFTVATKAGSLVRKARIDASNEGGSSFANLTIVP
jgi:hypothetical protein